MSVDWQNHSPRIAASPAVLSRALDDEMVLYHPSTDEVTQLDAIATHVWLLLDNPPTLGELVSVLSERFGADPAVIRADVLPLLDRLFEAQLIAPAIER